MIRCFSHVRLLDDSATRRAARRRHWNTCERMFQIPMAGSWRLRVHERFDQVLRELGAAHRPSMLLVDRVSLVALAMVDTSGRYGQLSRDPVVGLLPRIEAAMRLPFVTRQPRSGTETSWQLNTVFAWHVDGPAMPGLEALWYLGGPNAVITGSHVAADPDEPCDPGLYKLARCTGKPTRCWSGQ